MPSLGTPAHCSQSESSPLQRPPSTTRPACFPKPDCLGSPQEHPLFPTQDPPLIVSYRLTEPISRLWTHGLQECLLPPMEHLQNYPQLADERCVQVFQVEEPRSSRSTPRSVSFAGLLATGWGNGPLHRLE